MFPWIGIHSLVLPAMGPRIPLPVAIQVLMAEPDLPGDLLLEDRCSDFFALPGKFLGEAYIDR
jgi:hypothetical protein